MDCILPSEYANFGGDLASTPTNRLVRISSSRRSTSSHRPLRSQALMASFLCSWPAVEPRPWPVFPQRISRASGLNYPTCGSPSLPTTGQLGAKETKHAHKQNRTQGNPSGGLQCVYLNRYPFLGVCWKVAKRTMHLHYPTWRPTIERILAEASRKVTTANAHCSTNVAQVC